MRSGSRPAGRLSAWTTYRLTATVRSGFRRGPQRWFRRIAPRLPPPVVERAVGVKRWITRQVDPDGELVRPDLAAVFDVEWYRRAVADFGGARSALEHYLSTGWRKGFDPSPLFAVRWYLEQHPDVAEASLEPLTYYLDVGWRRGDDPCPQFSSRWYQEQVVAAEVGDQSPLVHYLTEGARNGLSVNPVHAALIAGEPPTLTPEASDEFALLSSVDGDCELPVSMLADLPFDLVTFDLWDTLVRRTRPADAAKVATARRLWLSLGAPVTATTWDLYTARVSTEATLAGDASLEDYEAHDVLSALVIDADLDVHVEDVKVLVADLVAAEAADERACTVANQPVADLVARFGSRPDPAAVMVLSDFYLGGTELGSILHEHHVDVPVDRILSSCETHASKRLGTAYELARRRSGLQRPRHLHIGDHPVVDGERAVQSGATAALVRPLRDGMPGPGELTPGSYDDLPRRLTEVTSTLHRAAGSAARMSTGERHAHGAGAQLAALAVAHVAAALETAVRHDVDVIHYLSREGAFLARVHREVAHILLPSGAPRPVHLEVSRRSTFAPSLRDLAPSSMARMWRQYSHQTMQAMLVSLGLDDQRHTADLRACGLELDTLIHDIARSDAVRSFLERPTVRAAVLGRAAEQRALLTEYLGSRDFGRRKAVVVDVGWRGTIQDNLALLRPECDVHGVYVGLFPYLNPQPPNSRKSAVAFDGNLGEAFAHVDPPAVLEAPFTALVPAPVEYRRSPSGGVVAVGQAEHGRADHLVEAFQAGLLMAAPTVADHYVRWGASSTLLRRGLQSFVQSLYDEPPDGLADIWFESAHDDTFGVLNDTPYQKVSASTKLLSSVDPVEERPEAIASRWPKGYARWLPVRGLDLLGRIVRDDRR